MPRNQPQFRKKADQPQTGTLKVEGADAQDDHYTYLKYDLSQFADRNAIEAAKLRVNLPDAENDLTKDHVLYAYNVTEDMEGADFSGLTWENTPVKDTETFAGTIYEGMGSREKGDLLRH